MLIPHNPWNPPDAVPPLDDEAPWPAELAALAEQLKGEAESLAACFPAADAAPSQSPGVGPGAVPMVAGRRPSIRLGLALAVPLALAGGGAWWTTSELDRRAERVPGGDVAEASPGADGSGPEDRWDERSVVLPALLLQCSAPELEGVLDVWEPDAGGRERLSL